MSRLDRLCRPLLVLACMTIGATAALADGGAGLAAPARVRFWPIPTPDSQPLEITMGGDGNLRIARITTDGVITPLPPIPNSGPTGIFANRGAVWFLAYESNRVYRISTR